MNARGEPINRQPSGSYETDTSFRTVLNMYQASVNQYIDNILSNARADGGTPAVDVFMQNVGSVDRGLLDLSYDLHSIFTQHFMHMMLQREVIYHCRPLVTNLVKRVASLQGILLYLDIPYREYDPKSDPPTKYDGYLKITTDATMFGASTDILIGALPLHNSITQMGIGEFIEYWK